VLSLAQISAETAHLAGGKMANLGRLAAARVVPVPEGFVITAAAFARFMAHAGVMGQVRERLAAVRIDALEQMELASAEIFALIAASELPPGNPADRERRGAAGPGRGARLRGSQQRGLGGRGFQFRRQYSSCLNVPASRSSAVTRLWGASSPAGDLHYRTKGFAEEEMAMAVGVMRMVEARRRVLYTRDPPRPGREVMVINGLGPGRPSSTERPCRRFAVDRASGAIVERRVAERIRGGGRAGGGVHRAGGEGERSVALLTDRRRRNWRVTAPARDALPARRTSSGRWTADDLGALQSRPLQPRGCRRRPVMPRRVGPAS
jgi:pyruvate,water dikinase